MMTAEQLKNSILLRALQGRLVDQNPADEPAQKLLERIRAEKKAIIKSSTIPKDKKMEDVSEDEKFFDLPENWIWTRMGELFQHNTGKALNGTNKEGEVLTYITTSNLYWNRFELDNLKSMPFTESEVEKCTVTKGDLLVCEGGDYGRAAIWNYDFDMRIQNHVHRLRTYLPLCTEYFYYVINFLKGTGLIKGKGIAIQGLSSGALHNLAVPLPPFEEQKRIVAKIEELMPFVEQYAKASTKLNKLNASFPEQMKKSILQQAVMGKLVPQNPNDEPANVLLKKIAEEKQKLIKEGKIKKQKPLPAITEDEIPFDIPESWKWVRLHEIVTILGDGIHGTPSYNPFGEYYFVNGNNLSEGKIVIKDDTKRVNKTEFEKYQKPLGETSILVSINGTLGNTAFYNGEPVMLGKSACYLNLVDARLKKYIYWLLKSDYFMEYAVREATGTTIRNVSLKAMNSLPIPLPPLKEQERIVARLEIIKPTFENLFK